MAGKRLKPPGQLQGGRANVPVAQLISSRGESGIVAGIPEPPMDLQPGALEAWRSFWADPVLPKVINYGTDGPALRRYFECLSDREAMKWRVRKTPLVKGSTGQPVVNPLNTLIVNLTREIERLEEHFGLTPLARMRLGIAIGEAADSLDGIDDALFGNGGEMEAAFGDYLAPDAIDIGWSVSDALPGPGTGTPAG